MLKPLFDLPLDGWKVVLSPGLRDIEFEPIYSDQGIFSFEQLCDEPEVKLSEKMLKSFGE